MEHLYKERAGKIRLHILDMIYKAKASHIASCFSIADILSVLYLGYLKITLNDPNRDRFILSKGHASAALYAALALQGFFPEERLLEFKQNNSELLGHPSFHIPGVEYASGSLGHGLSIACGLSLAAERESSKYKTVALLSDGEMNEGSTWEAIMFAAHHKLSSLTMIIDKNGIQSLGNTQDVMQMNLAKQLEAFGLEVIEINGHDHLCIHEALHRPAKTCRAIIAHTIKGKGVSFMENSLTWHYKNPSEQEYEKAKEELCAQYLSTSYC